MRYTKSEIKAVANAIGKALGGVDTEMVTKDVMRRAIITSLAELFSTQNATFSGFIFHMDIVQGEIETKAQQEAAPIMHSQNYRFTQLSQDVAATSP